MLADYYLWIKAFHVFAMVAWMAGMFYLPRLYVYHVTAPAGGELSETLKVMERRLLRIIMNPAMILTLVFGLLLMMADPSVMKNGWIHVKLTAVFVMAGLHGMMSKYRKDFATDTNRKSEKFYRILNEVPTALLLVIVIMAVVKPF